MPPIPLRIRCRDCRYSIRNGYFPTATIKADHHAERYRHTLDAKRLDGELFAVIAPPYRSDSTPENPPF